MNRLFSDVANRVTPYEWEEGISSKILRFDANTLPSPPPSVKKLLAELCEYCPINEYSDPAYKKLRRLVAKYEGATEDMITITNSGDEALDVLAKTFLNPGDKFLIQPPTYDMFKIQCEINRGVAVEVPLIENSFQVDVSQVIKVAKESDAKITFICNPNNPSGTVTTNVEIEKIVNASPGIILVDEAYREFYGKTSLPLLKKYENVVILRSFSKFGAMAGARIGYLIASPEISKIFNAIRFPMGVSYFSYRLAELLLAGDGIWIKNQVRMIREQRKYLAKEFQKLCFVVYPSFANFLLVKIGDRAREVFEKLRAKNILIRDRSKKKYLAGCVRVTVRNAEQNERLVRSLREIL